MSTLNPVQINLDVNQHMQLKQQHDAERAVPIPAANYSFYIDSVETQETSKGGKMINIKLKVADGPMQGKVVFDTANIEHEKQQVVSIAYQQLAAYAAAVGWPYLQYAEQLAGQYIDAKTYIEKGKDGYEDKSRIRDVAPYGTLPKGQAPGPAGLPGPGAQPTFAQQPQGQMQQPMVQPQMQNGPQAAPQMQQPQQQYQPQPMSHNGAPQPQYAPQPQPMQPQPQPQYQQPQGGYNPNLPPDQTQVINPQAFQQQVQQQMQQQAPQPQYQPQPGQQQYPQAGPAPMAQQPMQQPQQMQPQQGQYQASMPQPGYQPQPQQGQPMQQPQYQQGQMPTQQSQPAPMQQQQYQQPQAGMPAAGGTAPWVQPAQ